MGFADGLAGQLARPRGVAGRVLGNAMDLANRTPNRLALEMLAPRDGERVLDAGCGTGAALAAVRRQAKVAMAGIDASSVMVAAARRRLGEDAELELAAIEQMTFKPMSFDAALALNVLYFNDPAGRMIASLYRCLKPGGRLIVYVTHRASMERWAFARAGMHRLFDPEELRDALVAGGFVHTRICVHDVAVTGSVRGLLARATR